MDWRRRALYETSPAFADMEPVRTALEQKFKGYGHSIIVWIDVLAVDYLEASAFVSNSGVNYVSDHIGVGRFKAYGFLPWDNEVFIQFKLKFGGA